MESAAMSATSIQQLCLEPLFSASLSCKLHQSTQSTVLLTNCFMSTWLLYRFMCIDANARIARKGAAVPKSEAVLRGSLRWTFILAGFIICLTLPLTSSTLFSASDFSISQYLKLDMLGIKNILHGGFVIAGWSNF